jgi:peptide/nickel transport system substrate-binding protein
MTRANHLSRRRFIEGLTAGAVAGTGLLAAARKASAKKKGGTLTVGMPNDWNTFDPHNLAFANFTLQQNLYDTLIRYDQNLKPLPGLAERWVVAPDGQSVTLTLRKGVKFHSGKDLTSADVVKNFEKAADKDRGHNMYPAVTNVAEVTAPDAGTVLIKFKKVSPEVYDLLQAMAIIEPAAMDSLKNRGSGTGPFKFAEWVPGDHTTLERNTAYWNQGTPWADRVVFKVFSDSDAMVAALQSGICDLIISVPPKDTARLAKEFNMVRGTPGALTYEVRVNGAKPPFDKKEARQALHYAIDRQGIVNNVLFGVSEPTVLPFSRNSPAYDRSTLAKYPFDLKRAKEMLDKAGLAGGRAECLTLPQFPELPAISQVLKADLAKIGFTLDIVVQDSTLYYKRMLGGDFQLCPSFSGNTQKYPTRVALNSIYRPANNPVWGNEVPKAYLDALNEANGTIDPVKQKAAFAKFNQAILDEAWVLSIAYRQTVFGLAKHVDGFAYTVDDMAVLENVSLEK